MIPLHSQLNFRLGLCNIVIVGLLTKYYFITHNLYAILRLGKMGMEQLIKEFWLCHTMTPAGFFYNIIIVLSLPKNR